MSGVSRTVVLLALLLVSVAVAAPAMAESQTVNMEEAVKMALDANYGVKAARSGVTAAEFGEASAKGAFYPSLAASYSYTRSDHEKPYRDYATSGRDTFTLGAGIHQDVYTAGRVQATYDKAIASREQAEHTVDNSELGLILQVQSNFLALLTARETVRSAQDSVTRLKSQLKVTTAFYDVGLKPRLDVLQAEVELASAEDTLLQAQNTVATQEARLNTLLVQPLDASIAYVGELAYRPFNLALEECLNRAFDKRPDIAMAEADVRIAEQTALQAESALYPQVGADVSWSRSGESPQLNGGDDMSTEWSSWSAGVSAQWQVFDWKQNYNTWKQAQEGVKASENILENMKQETQYEVKSRVLKIGETNKRIMVARKALESAKESYRMAVARYQAQVGTNTDVLDAQSRLTSAEATLTSALADYEVSLANLYYAIGEKNPALLALQ